jgi:hypothetical protein
MTSAAGFRYAARERAAYKERLEGLSSKPDRSANSLSDQAFAISSPCQMRLISAAHSGCRRGCRAAGSPASCRHPASARAFPDRRRRVGIARRSTSPACRRAARTLDRWSSPAARRFRAAAAVRIRSTSRAQAAQSAPEASPATMGLAHAKRRRAPATQPGATRNV